MMEKPEESLGGIPIRLLKLNEQIHIALRRSLTPGKRPEKVQPLHVEFLAGWYGNLLDFLQRPQWIPQRYTAVVFE